MPGLIGRDTIETSKILAFQEHVVEIRTAYGTLARTHSPMRTGPHVMPHGAALLPLLFRPISHGPGPDMHA